MHGAADVPLRLWPPRNFGGPGDYSRALYEIPGFRLSLQGAPHRAGAVTGVSAGNRSQRSRDTSSENRCKLKRGHREITMQLSRRKFLRGVSLTGAMVRVGLPPLA